MDGNLIKITQNGNQAAAYIIRLEKEGQIDKCPADWWKV